MLDLIIEYDQKLFVWLNNLGNEYFDWFWMLLTNKVFNFLVYSIALIYLFKKIKTKSFISMILFLLILIFISDQTSNLFKNYFERLRPCHDEQIFNFMRLVKNSCGGLYSFFSAHASNSFSLASFSSCRRAGRCPGRSGGTRATRAASWPGKSSSRVSRYSR